LRKKLSELTRKQQKYRQSKQDLENITAKLFSEQSQNQIQINKQYGQINYLKNKNQELNQFQEQLLSEIESERKKVEQLQIQLKNNSVGREKLLNSELEQTQEKLEQAESDLREKEEIIAQLESKLAEN
jgi:hypothetical protein